MEVSSRAGKPPFRAAAAGAGDAVRAV